MNRMRFRRLGLTLVALATLSVGACGSDDQNDLDTDADDLIKSLCKAVDRCDPSLNQDDCSKAMYSSIGNAIWDNFGLEGESNTTNQVEENISNGKVKVDPSALQSCLGTLDQVCTNEGQSVNIGTYGNVQNIIPGDSECGNVLSQ